MSTVYPAELFVLRRQVRDKSKCSAAITRRAEQIAIQTRSVGISHFRALNNAMAYLWEASHRGRYPGDAA